MSSLSQSNKISESKKIELIVFHFFRVHYEKNSKNAYIADAMKHLTMLFCQKCVPSTLLNFNQDIEFVKLLSNQLGCIIESFKFLYRASENQFKARPYHKACDGADKTPQIVIVKSNHGNIFGGYRSAALVPPPRHARNAGYTSDKNAFLYLIKSDDHDINDKCPIIFKIRPNQTQWAFAYGRIKGPIFGFGADFRIDQKSNVKQYNEKEDIWFSKNSSSLSTYFYDKEKLKIEIGAICGGNDVSTTNNTTEWLFDVREYEVWQIIMK